MERRPGAFVTHADVGARLSSDFDGRRSKSGLRAEYAAGAPLTGKTVTDRYADGLFGHRDRELATTARCSACRHGSSAHGFSDELADRRLDLGRQLRDGERGRPHHSVIEVRLVAESE